MRVADEAKQAAAEKTAAEKAYAEKQAAIEKAAKDARDQQAPQPGLAALQQNQVDACARGQCHDDIEGQLFAYTDQHTS
jgi:membrane protein involved in colicin uptake